MEQETPTLEEPTVTQLPEEECQQEPASPTPFLPTPKSAAATQLDTEQEEVPAWVNCSPTSPADDMQEDDDDDGLQQQLQRAEHLTMTLERVNVRDSDSEPSGISDEDDEAEEEPDDKMSQKDEDEHPDQDEWRWMPRESGRWQGAQLLRGDWFHTQITAAETAYVNATGIYDNMPDPDGGIAAGLSRTRQQKTRSRVRTRFKRSRQNSGKHESDKETRAGAQDAFQRHLHLYTMGRCWIYCRAVPPAATGAKRWYNYRGQSDLQRRR